MSHSLEPDKIEGKFAFFIKKEKKQKMKLKDKIALSILALLFIGVQNSSVNHLKMASNQFQQKNVTLYQPETLPSSSAFVKSNPNELLVSYLTQTIVDYKDIDNSLEILKANKKDIPSYLFTSTLAKIRGDNISLYTKKNRELRQEYSTTRSFGFAKVFVSETIPQKNFQKFQESNKIYVENFDKLEAKINTYFPKNKDSKPKETKANKNNKTKGM